MESLTRESAGRSQEACLAKLKTNALLLEFLLVVFLLGGCTQTKEISKKSASMDPGAAAPFALNFPAGLPPDGVVIPRDNPMTLEKVKLGRRLFFEKSISIDGSISCATCHIPE